MSSLRLKLTRLRLRIVAHLCQDSLIHRFLHIDDHVKELQQSPAGMFFYNQRAVFFAGSGLFLIVVTGLTLILTGHKEQRTVLVLWIFWSIAVGYTLGLHSRFRKHLALLSSSAVTNTLPSLFGEYFLLDFSAVFFMIVCGKAQGLSLHPFALLLVANTIVYSAYVGGGRGFGLFIPGILYLLLILTFLFFPVPSATMMSQPPAWFNTLLYLGPLSSMLIVTVISVTLISWVRSSEYQNTQLQLELLGKYESILAGADRQRESSKDAEHSEKYSEVYFRSHVRAVFEDLCSHKTLFWYDSACMWLIKKHQDHDGPLLVLGTSFNFDEIRDLEQGLDGSKGFLSTKELVVINSMKYRRGKLREFQPRFRANVDAPAGFVPLERHGKRIGVIALYGKEVGPPPQRQDRAFLRSLGSIVSNTMEQWEGRFKTFPQRDLNDLFNCQSLDEVFDQVVVILQKYLLAGACEVIFRPNERGKEMKIVAALGFLEDRLNIEYIVGRGKTGECAQKGITIRHDDVAKHRDEGFDPQYLGSLEVAHGKPILSWMAIPIGKKGHNHGVIKVVNRTSPWKWFTDEDQQLGEDLAFRLQVIIEKFQYIEETVVAKTEAEEQAKKAELSAADASANQKQAENFARQRQIDLMTMTHQLQGPLNPVVGALSGLQQLSLPRSVQEEIEFAKALAESCLTLCWGTSTTFAQAVGQKLSFLPDEIDAPAEMRKLCRMLQLTNTDNNLDFRYREDADFPKLSINRGVFTSVLFSLIHNAMKYADKQSTVYLECTFERVTGEAALKVKSFGVPIYTQEADKIFNQFVRGQALQKTSLKYDGRGLGLWVARELMRSVGGDLTVELPMEHPKLSIFVVHLPGGLSSLTEQAHMA